MSEYPRVMDEYYRRVTQSGAAAVYGICLSEYREVKDLLDELLNYASMGDSYGRWFNKDYFVPEDDPIVQMFLPRFVKAFSKIGIVIPPEAELSWTGREVERVAEGGAPCKEFLIGFGLGTLPHDYPRMHRSFTAKARWHTWAWVMWQGE